MPAAAPAAPAAPAPELTAAASWARRVLSPSFHIIADPAVRTALKAAGFTNFTTLARTPNSRGQSFDFVVSSPTMRAMARTDGELNRALNSSAPVAAFGSGARQVVIRQATDLSLATVISRRRADKDTRIVAERQLLTNPAVHASVEAQAALRAGDLDLRAATVLTVLAGSSHVNVLAVNVDNSERAAGLPARSIDVRTDAPGSASAILSSLPSAFAPSKIIQLANDTNRLSWLIVAVPPVGLN
ncbi:MAG: hypothetical protein ABI775_09105 [Pseudonocardiales bacterium]